MVNKVAFYECEQCGKQFDSYSEADSCEWTHEYDKENGDD